MLLPILRRSELSNAPRRGSLHYRERQRALRPSPSIEPAIDLAPGTSQRAGARPPAPAFSRPVAALRPPAAPRTDHPRQPPNVEFEKWRICSAIVTHPKLPGPTSADRQLHPLHQLPQRLRRAAHRAVLPDRRPSVLRRFAPYPAMQPRVAALPKETRSRAFQRPTSCPIARAGLAPAGSTDPFHGARARVHHCLLCRRVLRIIDDLAGKDRVHHLAVKDRTGIDLEEVPIQDNHVRGLALLNAAELRLLSHRVGCA